MKPVAVLTGKPGVDGSDQSGLLHQYVCCVLNINTGQNPGCSITGSGIGKGSQKVKYLQKSINAVKWLSVVQILSGLVMFFSQIGPIAWNIQLLSERVVRVYMRYDVFDFIATGIWTGLFILVTGIIGLVASRRNTKCLIVSHMVLNVFALIFAINMILWASVTINTLADCKISGRSVDIPYKSSRTYKTPSYSYNYYKDPTGEPPVTMTTTTTTEPSKIAYMFGERFDMTPIRQDDYDYNSDNRQRFYCESGIFSAWILLEVVMILCAISTFVFTIWLMVKNSEAMCLCCRRCCSAKDDKREEDDVSLVS